MPRTNLILGSLLLALGPCLLADAPREAPPPATEPPARDPLRIDKVEQETVRLVLLDVLVLDRQDRTVAGLTAEDFEIHAGGEWLPVDTLDVRCDDGLDDPRGVRRAALRTPPAAPEAGRRIVMTFDYEHLTTLERFDVLRRAQDMVRHQMVEGDQIMVAALIGGLRVELPFTGDRDLVLAALRRMQYDITLWNGDFSHQSENGFVRGLTSLLDVADTTPGPKALLLFSAMGDVPLDSQFRQIAAEAAASRCAIYPVDVLGMRHASQGDQFVPSEVVPRPG